MRDHFIPIRKQDLVALLSNELEAGDCTDFEKLCHIVESVFHHDYHQQLESLKSDYAAFDPDADANELIDKLKKIRDANAAERQRRTFVGKKGWQIEVVPATGGAGSRIRNIQGNAKYYFGESSRFIASGVAVALEASECDNIGTMRCNMKLRLNPNGSGKGKNTGKYLGKDLAWWREHTQDVLNPSMLAFAKSKK